MLTRQSSTCKGRLSRSDQLKLAGKFGAYVSWAMGMPDDFWAMGEGDRWLAFKTKFRSYAAYAASALGLLCVQPLILVVLALWPGAQTWLDAEPRRIKMRAVMASQENAFWLPKVAKPHIFAWTW